MTIEYLKKNNLVILECISGSKAYGLDTPESDTDVKGVFIYPKNLYYGLDYVPQVSNDTNDEVYYELGRFMELLSVNNPNILELLNTPQDKILLKHSVFNRINKKMFLSKLCKNTFGKYAISQIKKARGLKKKIVNPMPKEKKSVLDYCFINFKNGSVSLKEYLQKNNLKQENCGLVNIPNMNNVYGLYYNENEKYKGVIQSENSNDISLSSIEKGEKQITLMYFNKDGYSFYCKEYKEYWDWIEKRNEVRYESTKAHGKKYDAKNMMHTFRLLEMAIEIGESSEINVLRPNRDFLLRIKKGEFEYEELLTQASKKQELLEEVFINSNLPEKPDLNLINRLTFEIRNELYQE